MSQALINSFFFAAAAGPPVDPFASQVTLLLRMEGTPGSSVIVDSSPLLTPPTNNAPSDLYLSTEQFKSGSSSLKCAWTGGNLQYNNTANHQLTGDFTVETWVYLTQAPAFDFTAVRGDPARFFWIKPARTLHFYEGGFQIDGATAMTLNAWHHLAATRSGTTIRLWLNGVQQGGTYTSSSTYCTNFDITIIGNGLGYTTTPGYMDLVRITKGVDRYGTASFTPPADY